MISPGRQWLPPSHDSNGNSEVTSSQGSSLTTQSEVVPLVFRPSLLDHPDLLSLWNLLEAENVSLFIFNAREHKLREKEALL